MSQQHINAWNAAADAFTQRLQAITDEQWDLPTPCSEWTVRQVVDHTVGVQAGFTGGTVGAEIAEGSDWAGTLEAIRGALADESALDGTTEMGGMGTVPKTVPFGISAMDLLIHTWDVARAIGADEVLPADAVSMVHAGLQRFPEDMRKNSTMFAGPVACADDADEQTKMLSLSGRQV